jgi:hypothetical protein
MNISCMKPKLPRPGNRVSEYFTGALLYRTVYWGVCYVHFEV